MVVLGSALGDHLDPRADPVAVALGSPQGDLQPVAGFLASVHPDFRVRGKRGGHDIDASISVQVSEGQAAMPRCRGGSQPGLLGERDPLAAPVVLYWAGISEYGVVLIYLRARERPRLHMTASHEQVLPSIVVEVIESGPI